MAYFKLRELKSAHDIPHELIIGSATSLSRILLEYAEYFKATPQMLTLEAPTRDSLDIGIGGLMACVHFQQASGDPPYLMAKGTSNIWDEYLEFLAGGTPSEIPLALCVPLMKAIDIAVYFFLNERIPEDVEWIDQ